MNETEYATSLSYANGLIQKQQETIDEQYHTISTANIWNSKLKDRLDLAMNCLQEVFDSEGLMYVKTVLDQLKDKEENK